MAWRAPALCLPRQRARSDALSSDRSQRNPFRQVCDRVEHPRKCMRHVETVSSQYLVLLLSLLFSTCARGKFSGHQSTLKEKATRTCVRHLVFPKLSGISYPKISSCSPFQKPQVPSWCPPLCRKASLPSRVPRLNAKLLLSLSLVAFSWENRDLY